MKKLVTLLLVGVLGLALVGPAAAKKKKPKPPALVPVDQQMFLRGDACSAEAMGLSLEDAVDADTCAYVKGGILNDTVPDGTPGPLGAAAWQTWPAFDGVPFKLDATKPVTGEIFTQGIFPLVSSDYPGLSAGNVRLSVRLVGESGGEEKTIGEFTEEFLVKPGDGVHTTAVEITPDAALNGLDFTSLTLYTKIGGEAVGHTFYKLSEPSSYIKVPTLAAAK